MDVTTITKRRKGERGRILNLQFPDWEGTMRADIETDHAVRHAVHQVAGALMRKFPALINFKEELYQVRTVEECRRRSVKYLNIQGRHYTIEDLTRDMHEKKVEVKESQDGRKLPTHRDADTPKITAGNKVLERS